MRIGVVGAGIIGLAVARRLTELRPDATLTVFEKESHVALHQTGRNSGVVHAGIYYAPGSLRHSSAGTVSASCANTAPDAELPLRSAASSLSRSTSPRSIGSASSRSAPARTGCRVSAGWGGPELREIEPHAAGVAALHSSTTAITDFRSVARAFRDDVIARGDRATGVEADRSARERRWRARPRRLGARVRSPGHLRRPSIRQSGAHRRGRTGADHRPVPLQHRINNWSRRVLASLVDLRPVELRTTDVTKDQLPELDFRSEVNL